MWIILCLVSAVLGAQIPKGEYMGSLLFSSKYVKVVVEEDSNLLRLALVDERGDIWRDDDRPFGINATIIYDEFDVAETSRSSLKEFVDAIFYVTRIPLMPDLLYLEDPVGEFVLSGRFSLTRVLNNLQLGIFRGTHRSNEASTIEVLDDKTLVLDVGIAKVRFAFEKVGLDKWELRFEEPMLWGEREFALAALSDFAGMEPRQVYELYNYGDELRIGVMFWLRE